MKWQIEAGEQKSDRSEHTTSYLRPVITRVIGPGARSGTTRGGEAITISGMELGPAGPLFMDYVVYGGLHQYILTPGNPRFDTKMLFEASDCSVTAAHERIECVTTEGTGSMHHWRVSIGDQRSMHLGPPHVETSCA